MVYILKKKKNYCQVSSGKSKTITIFCINLLDYQKVSSLKFNTTVLLFSIEIYKLNKKTAIQEFSNEWHFYIVISTD